MAKVPACGADRSKVLAQSKPRQPIWPAFNSGLSVAVAVDKGRSSNLSARFGLQRQDLHGEYSDRRNTQCVVGGLRKWEAVPQTA